MVRFQQSAQCAYTIAIRVDLKCFQEVIVCISFDSLPMWYKIQIWKLNTKIYLQLVNDDLWVENGEGEKQLWNWKQKLIRNHFFSSAVLWIWKPVNWTATRILLPYCNSKRACFFLYGYWLCCSGFMCCYVIRCLTSKHGNIEKTRFDKSVLIVIYCSVDRKLLLNAPCVTPILN